MMRIALWVFGIIGNAIKLSSSLQTTTLYLTENEEYNLSFDSLFSKTGIYNIEVEFSWKDNSKDLNFKYSLLESSSKEVHKITDLLTTNVVKEISIEETPKYINAFFQISGTSIISNKELIKLEIDKKHLALSDNSQIIKSSILTKNMTCSKFHYAESIDRYIHTCHDSSRVKNAILLQCPVVFCSEKYYYLKSSENAQFSFSKINTLVLPGERSDSVTALVWYEGEELLEKVSIDEKGNIDSVFLRMQFKIKNINYIANTVLLFESEVRENDEYEYHSSYWEPGNPLSLREFQLFPSKGIFETYFMGTQDSKIFIILFTNIKGGDFLIFEYQKELRNFKFILPIKVSSSLSSNSQFKIFQIGEYSFLIIKETRIELPEAGANVEKKMTTYFWFKKGSYIPIFAQDLPPFDTSLVFSTGVNKLYSMSMEDKDINIIRRSTALTAKRISFIHPYLKVDPKPLFKENAASHVLSGPLFEENRFGLRDLDPDNKNPYIHIYLTGIGGSKEKVFDINIKTIKSKSGRFIFKDTIKTDANKNSIVIKQEEILQKELRLSDIIAGSFVSVSKITIKKLPKISTLTNDMKPINSEQLLTPISETIDLTNEINPFIKYQEIFTNSSTLKKKFLKSNNFIIVNRGVRKESFTFFSIDMKNNTGSILKVDNTDLIPKTSFSSSFDGTYPMIYNETLIVIKGSKHVWSIDIMNSKSNNPIKEMLFDKGSCLDVMLIRHSTMDAMFWCKINGKLESYSAREMLSGKVGISRIKIKMAFDLDLTNIVLRYFESVQDYFYGIGLRTQSSEANKKNDPEQGEVKEYVLYIFKIYSGLILQIDLVETISLNITSLEIHEVLDFTYLNERVIVYGLQNIGFDKRAKFFFYFLENPEKISLNKEYSLDHHFSPDKNYPNLLRFQSLRTNALREREYFPSLLYVKVKYNYQYDNVILIDPISPLISTVPTMIFNFKSEVTISLGIAISTNSAYWDYGMTLVFAPINKNEDIRILRVIASQPMIKVAEEHAGGVQASVEIYKNSDSNLLQQICFEDYRLGEGLREEDNDIVLDIITDQKDPKDNKILEFSNQSSSINLNSLFRSFSQEKESKNSQIYYELNTVGAVQGNVFTYYIKLESSLEEVAKTIRLEPHVEAISPETKTRISEVLEDYEKCSETILVDIELFTNNKDLFHVHPDDSNIEKYFVKACPNNSQTLLYFSRLYHGFIIGPNSITIERGIQLDETEQIVLSFEDSILSIKKIDTTSGRILLIDPIFVQFSTQFNIINTEVDVNPKNSDLEKDKEKIKKTVLQSCDGKWDKTDIPKIEQDKCLSKIMSYSLIEYQSIVLDREYLDKDSQDSMFKLEKVTDAGYSVKSGIYRATLLEFGLRYTFENEYIIKFNKVEYLLDVIEMRQIQGKKVTVDNSHLLSIDLCNILGVELHEESSIYMVKKERSGVWIMMETRKWHNYLFRYPDWVVSNTTLRDESNFLNVVPQVWRIDNPYYGETPSVYFKGIMYDWIYVLPKVFERDFYYMIYILPYHKLCPIEEDHCISGNTYTQSVIESKEGLSFDILNPDQSQITGI